jgi:hypothetical protein
MLHWTNVYHFSLDLALTGPYEEHRRLQSSGRLQDSYQIKHIHSWSNNNHTFRLIQAIYISYIAYHQ